MKKIKSEIIADSVNEHGDRITTFVLTYPRIIHAELLTHRLFSRNAASSRAIPASKMIADIQEDPFIPVAFQKAHKGMQGTEYFEKPTEITPRILSWKQGALQAVEKAKGMLDLGITKQLVNRILEPYQWYTCIVTATEYDNFFELRCPQYFIETSDSKMPVFKSKKDAKDYCKSVATDSMTDLDWLKCNTGQGEIHISLLAEAMWDARNESEPKELKAGQWHIPFGDRIDHGRLEDLLEAYARDRGEHYDEIHTEHLIKIATARCARVSYLNFEGKDDYAADIKLYDMLKASGHFSPFEHCARAMSKDEFFTHSHNTGIQKDEIRSLGWSGNFRGFVQLRQEI